MRLAGVAADFFHLGLIADPSRYMLARLDQPPPRRFRSRSGTPRANQATTGTATEMSTSTAVVVARPFPSPRPTTLTAVAKVAILPARSNPVATKWWLP